MVAFLWDDVDVDGGGGGGDEFVGGGIVGSCRIGEGRGRIFRVWSSVHVRLRPR